MDRHEINIDTKNYIENFISNIRLHHQSFVSHNASADIESLQFLLDDSDRLDGPLDIRTLIKIKIVENLYQQPLP